MPVMIRTTSRAALRRGPKPPDNAVILCATHLPNPFGKLNSFIQEHELYGMSETDVVKEFLKTHCPKRLERLVSRGKTAVAKGNSLVIYCAHGKHRSRAVAELVGSTFHCSKCYYVNDASL